MKSSQKLIDAIKRFECCALTAYKDSVGVWTIGYGHTQGVKSGQDYSVSGRAIFTMGQCWWKEIRSISKPSYLGSCEVC